MTIKTFFCIISVILSISLALDKGRGNMTSPPTSTATSQTPIIVTPCKLTDDSCTNKTFTPSPTQTPTIYNNTNNNNGRTNITYPPTHAITPTISPIYSNKNTSTNDNINASFTPTISPMNNPTNDGRNNVTKTPTFTTNIPTTNIPTNVNDIDPTLEPTTDPTIEPTLNPTINPTYSTNIPTYYPTIIPTSTPTLFPTIVPTKTPTLFPTIFPTKTPTRTDEGGVVTEIQSTIITVTELIKQSPKSNNKSISTGLIIGAAICGVCIVAFCVVLCIKCKTILNEEDENNVQQHVVNDSRKMTPDSEEDIIKTGQKTDDGFNALMNMIDNIPNVPNENENENDDIINIVNTTKDMDDDDIIEIVNETKGGMDINKQVSRNEGMIQMVQQLEINEFEVNDEMDTNTLNMNEDGLDVDEILVGKETNDGTIQ